MIFIKGKKVVMKIIYNICCSGCFNVNVLKKVKKKYN